MATKFTRGAADVPGRAPPYQSLPSAPAGVGVWRWLLMAYVLVAVGFFAASRLGAAGDAVAFAFRPPTRGEAEVRAVRPAGGDPPRVALDLLVALPDGRGVPAEAVVPVVPGAVPAPGDRVAVIYRASRDGARARVEEAGLVPLPRRSD